MSSKGLVERLDQGETIICAEGYLLALTRSGYIDPVSFIPEFLLDQSDALRTLHYEFIHSGSDVTEAFQYNTTRAKLQELGREDDLEKINRISLKLAKEIAVDTGTLMAGGLCCSKIYEEGNVENHKIIRALFEDHVRWAKEEGADYIISETNYFLGEALIALEVILSFGLPAVVTLIAKNVNLTTVDNVPIGKACRILLDKGATIVGSNCFRGPDTMLQVVEEIIKEVPPEKVCALPIMYRTTEDQPTFFDFVDKDCAINNPVYPYGLDPFLVSIHEVTRFIKHCKELGMRYFGLCCGNSGSYTRAMAVALGRKPLTCKYFKKE